MVCAVLQWVCPGSDADGGSIVVNDCNVIFVNTTVCKSTFRASKLLIIAIADPAWESSTQLNQHPRLALVLTLPQWLSKAP